LPVLITLLGSFVVLIAFVAAQGPRVGKGTVILGRDLGGMSSSRAQNTLASAITAQPVPVVLEIQGKAFTVTLADLGLKIDVKKTVSARTRWMWWAGGDDDGPIVAEFEQSRLGMVVSTLESSLALPKNAAFVAEGDRVRLEESRAGQDVDTEKLKQVILASLISPGTTVVVPVKDEGPSLTTEQARAMNINRLLATYTTKFVIDGSRSENIKLAAARIDGAIVAPGERFSFNTRVGPRDAEHGYHEAHVFVGDHIEDGFGGGVCQVSTTLYNSVLLANLDVVERHNHSMTVDYVPLGRDAAVAYGALDFAFRNSTPGHLLISSDVKSGTITFRVFGDGPERKILIESRVLSKTDFQIEVQLDPKLPPGKREVTAGKPGYRVVTYKTVMDGNRVVKKDVLSYSTYRPMKQVIKEGTRI
jgi:vancomycin resistance protein YoaR